MTRGKASTVVILPTVSEVAKGFSLAFWQS